MTTMPVVLLDAIEQLAAADRLAPSAPWVHDLARLVAQEG